MGLLVDGVWQDRWYDTGKHRRALRPHREPSSATGSPPTAAPGPTGEGGFPAEPGRYHLYVSLACPWAHRTLIFRKLKGLEDDDRRLGRPLAHGRAGLDLRARAGRHRRPGQRRRLPPRDLHAGEARLHRPRHGAGAVGQAARTPSSTTSSSEIIRMLNCAFDGVGARPGDYYPADLRAEIDALNAAHLRHGQQRRLQGRLRHHAGGLRGGGPAAVRDASTGSRTGSSRRRYLAATA